MENEQRKKAREAYQRWRISNPERARELARKWARANPEKVRANYKRWRAKNPVRARELARRWARANPELVQRWKDENPEKVLEYRRQWRVKNPEKVRVMRGKEKTRGRLLILKAKGDRCNQCGNKFPPEALDFDHVRGLKMFSISQGVRRSPAVLLAEIEKCEVVCAVCHRSRTKERREMVRGGEA